MGYIKNQTATALTTDTASQAVGGMVLLSSQTASASASISFTSVITSTYKNYALVYSNVKAATGGTLNLLVSTNNGSSYLATGYQSGTVRFNYNSTATSNDATGTTAAFIGGNTTSTTQPFTGIAYLMNLQNGGQFLITGSVTYWGAAVHSALVCGYNTATSVNAIQIAMSSGNISTGTFSLFGIIE